MVNVSDTANYISSAGLYDFAIKLGGAMPGGDSFNFSREFWLHEMVAIAATYCKVICGKCRHIYG